MNLKKSTRLAKVISVEKQLKKRRYDKALEIISHFKLKDFTITKTHVKSEYKLKESDFKVLSCAAVDNPYYKCAPKMKLYLKQELEDKFGEAAQREKKIDELLINKN